MLWIPVKQLSGNIYNGGDTMDLVEMFDLLIYPEEEKEFYGYGAVHPDASEVQYYE
jgi:hypothetical protein